MAKALRSLVELTVVAFEGGAPIPGVNMVYVRRHRSRIDRFYVLPMHLRKIVRNVPSEVVHAFGDDWALAGATPIVRTFLGSSLGEARASSGLRKLNHYVLALTEQRSRQKASYKIAIGPDSYAEFDCDTLMPPVVSATQPKPEKKSLTPSVVFIGSFGGRKRGQLVERSVAEASKALGQNVALTVVGPATDAHNWSPETTHIAGADDKTVASLVAGAWVLMAPSLYEGFGIPAFEALSLETAVIASRNPGSEFIKSFGVGSSLELVDDSKLTSSLTARLRSGAVMSPSELAAVREGVNALLAAADPARLVREVYEPLAGRP